MLRYMKYSVVNEDMNNEVKSIASIITIAAVSLFLSIIPAFPIVGFSGVITLGALSGSLIGIFLKPRKGLIAVLIVAILTPVLNPGIVSLLGYFYFLPLLLSWLSSTLFFFKSPIYSIIIILASIVVLVIVHGKLITYYPQYLVYDLLMPFVAILFYYIFYFKNKATVQLRSIGAIINGVIGDHLGGSIAFSINYLYLITNNGVSNIVKLFQDQVALNKWVTTWSTVACIYPVERTIIIIIGIFVVMPTIAAWLKFFDYKTYIELR